MKPSQQLNDVIHTELEVYFSVITIPLSFFRPAGFLCARPKELG